jgi:DNA-binding CsgD family transcriptional regulator
MAPSDGLGPAWRLVLGERTASAWSTLTSTERAIVDLVLRGLPNQAIARMRGVSLGTVANQLTNVYRKLGVGSRRELLAEAAAQACTLDSATPGLLTSRQQQILKLAHLGRANKVIAATLSLSVSTVSTTLTRVRRKLLRASPETPRDRATDRARTS